MGLLCWVGGWVWVWEDWFVCMALEFGLEVIYETVSIPLNE